MRSGGSNNGADLSGKWRISGAKSAVHLGTATAAA